MQGEGRSSQGLRARRQLKADAPETVVFVNPFTVSTPEDLQSFLVEGGLDLVIVEHLDLRQLYRLERTTTTRSIRVGHSSFPSRNVCRS
jgi:hypothetical protein